MAIPEFRPGRALIGFMNEQEVRNFLSGTCVVNDQAELEAYLEKRRSGSELVRTLKPRVLFPIEQRDIRSEHSEYVRKLSAQPVFQQVFRGNEAVREVEISRVVGFQWYVDTEHAAELASKMREDEKFVLQTCLPLNFQQNLEITYDSTVPGVTFSSFSPKLVLSGVQVGGIGGVEISVGDQRVQQPAALFLIGTAVNYVQVVQFGSRFFLKNGYHRAYAALLAGRKYVPAVVSQASDYGETGAARPGFASKELLMSDVPPVVQDFLNDDISVTVKLRPMRKAIRIRADDFMLPR